MNSVARYQLESSTSTREIAEARKERLKLNSLKNAFYDAAKQLLFVCLIVSIAVLNTGSNGYSYKKTLENRFSLTNEYQNQVRK
jgi:hypothetical protein